MLIRALLAIVCVGLFAPHGGLRAVPSAQPPTELIPAGVPQDPAAVGYLNLHKRHPDAEEGVVEFNTLYTPTAALQRLSQIRGFLASFARLTERASSRISPADLAAIGNTGSDMQTIGFRNIPLIVEGTLLKQDYQLKQVEYALAELKHARKEISTRELDRSRRAYADATKRFQDFWDKKLPTD
jgi:hypothetical protein